MRWIKKLQAKWKLPGAGQVLLILVIFTCTGVTVVYLMRPLLLLVFGNPIPRWGQIVYVIVIFPIYNLILLLFGFLFGQFHFFWNYELKLIKGIFSIFKRNK
jgi:hypothetical protein